MARIRTHLIAGMILFFVLHTVCTAETWYINNETGRDTFSGTAPQAKENGTGPFKTIGNAVQRCQAGDTIVLTNTGKPYRENFCFQNKKGTAEKPIVFEGNGAVISGAVLIEQAQWKPAGEGLFMLEGLKLAPDLLVINGRVSQMDRTSPNVATPKPYKPVEELAPEEWTWTSGTGTLYFKTEQGKTIKDYIIEVSQLQWGFGISGNESAHITVRNVKVCHFSKDGFSIHGDGQHINFHNVESSYNVEDGISYHEHALGKITDSSFHHNGRGIADVTFSNTTYSRVRIFNNVGAGVLLHGGIHYLEDCEIFNNGDDITTNSFPAKSPDETGNIADVSLKNCLVYNTSQSGIFRMYGNIKIDHCNLHNVALTKISVSHAGKIFIQNSIIAGESTRQVGSRTMTLPNLEINENWVFASDYNCWYPGVIRIGNKIYEKGSWDDYTKATGQDKHSLVADPLLDDTYRLKQDSPCRKTGSGGTDMGIDN